MTKEEVKNFLKEILLSDFQIETEEFTVEWPKDYKYGNFSSNIAMVTAKRAGKNPIRLAEEIIIKIKSKNLNYFEKIEIVKPGFINFWESNEQRRIGMSRLEAFLKHLSEIKKYSVLV